MNAVFFFPGPRADRVFAIRASLARARDEVQEGRIAVLAHDGPLHIQGYGAYGYAYPPGFSTNRLSLLDRGFVANAPRPDTLRLLPPFVLDDEQAGAATAAIAEEVETLRGGTGEA